MTPWSQMGVPSLLYPVRCRPPLVPEDSHTPPHSEEEGVHKFRAERLALHLDEGHQGPESAIYLLGLSNSVPS